MPISFAEPLELTCPRCGRPFEAETWLVVDARERPDLVARILDGSLHDVHCPHCGQDGQAPAPALYHNRPARRVLFAVPGGMPEPEWRAAAEGLLWTLIGALPEARREPYLGELQAEDGIAGIAAVIRAEGLAETAELAGEAALPLVTAIQALLGARGADELGRVLDRHPILLDPQAVAILRELAHEAFKQGEEEAGGGFSRAAELLNEVRAMRPAAATRRESIQRDAAEPLADPPPEDPLDELAFALLRGHTGEMLAETVDQHPELLEAETGARLGAWALRARAEGKQRVADALDERLVALRSMRERYEAERPAFEAVQALLEAATPAELESVLVEHDALYTGAVDGILEQLASGSDPEWTALVEERRRFLHRVRQALANPPDQSTDG
jgi:hypothetical protein